MECAAALPSLASWLEEHCACSTDENGNLVSSLPALLAAALDSHMLEQAGPEQAAELSIHPYLRGKAPPPTKLHGQRTPAISIQAYAQRLLRYCGCSPVCFVVAYAYALRLAAAARCGSSAGVLITPRTAHRLLITGTVVAIKMCEDKYYSNCHYAQVGGVTIAEMNEMEMDLLQRLRFRARVDIPELCAALQEAHTRVRKPCASPCPPLPAGLMAAVCGQPRQLPAAALCEQEQEGWQDVETMSAAGSDSCSTVMGRQSSADSRMEIESTCAPGGPGQAGAAAAAAMVGSRCAERAPAWWPEVGASFARALPPPDGSAQQRMGRYSPSVKAQACRLEASAAAAEQAEREHSARREVSVDV